MCRPNAALNVTVTPSHSQIVFSKIVQLIPEVLFTTIKTRLNITSLSSEVASICRTAEELKLELTSKLREFEAETETEHACDGPLRNLPKEKLSRDEFKRIPWKGYIKKTSPQPYIGFK